MVGGNPEVSRFVGIEGSKVIVFAYWLSSLLAALAGVLLVGRMASADPRAGSTTSLDAIAATVIGKT